MIIHRGFKYRCYPTSVQEPMLDDWQGPQRWLWNLCNEQRILNHIRVNYDRGYISAMAQMYELTDLRAEFPWLADVPRDIQNQMLIDLDLAWQMFRKGLGGLPHYKAKRYHRTSTGWSDTRDFRLEGEGRTRDVFFPRVGMLEIVYHRPIEGKWKKTSVSKDGDAWHVSLTCEIDRPEPAPPMKGIVAIDRGVTNTIADSNGRIVKNPKHAEKSAKRVKRLQREAARKEKGSENYKKAQAKVGNAQRKVTRQRNHFLEVESKHYAESQSAVVFERLAIKNMTKSAKGTVENPGRNVAQKRALNRGLLGAALGEFKRKTKYKLEARGGRVYDVNPYRSSQTCSDCGHVDPNSRKGERFKCTKCGHAAHADVNAAKVLLQRGYQELAVEPTVTVCGGVGARGQPKSGKRKKQKLHVVRRGTRSKDEAKAKSVVAG